MTFNHELYSSFGFIKSISADELDHHTKQGWILLETNNVTEGQLFNLQTQIANPQPPQGSYGYSPVLSLNTQQLATVSTVKFLIGYPKESALKDLNDRITSLLYQNDNNYKTIRDLGISNDAKDKEVETLKTELTRTEAYRAEASKSLDDARKQIRTMEADLAKVRKAIGDLSFREIIDIK